MALPRFLAVAGLGVIGAGLIAAQRQRAAALIDAAQPVSVPPGADASAWFPAAVSHSEPMPAPLYDNPDLIGEPEGSEAPSMLEALAGTLLDAAEGAAVFLTGGMVDTAQRWIKAAADKKNAAYVKAAADAESRYGIPANLLVRQIWQESKFNPQAWNPSGASGIMQIIPKWHPGVDVWTPAAAIDYGARYLRSQFDRFGTWELALKAYNMGPEGLAQVLRGEKSEPRETQNYSRSILADIGLSGTI